MPQVEIDVSCPGCNAVFSVPVELCGEMAECTECSAVFEIPRIDEVPPTLNTDTGAIKGIAAPTPAPGAESNTAATNTVKLSRASIGMIPSIKDSFVLGQNASAGSAFEKSFMAASSAPAFKQPAAMPQQQAGGPAPFATPQPPPPVFQTQSQPKMTFTTPPAPPPPPPARPVPQPQAKPVTMTTKPAPPQAVPAPAKTDDSQQSAQKKTSSTQTSIAIQQIALDSLLPSWTKIQLKEGEELQDFQKINKNPAITAVLVSLPVLLTIVATLFAHSIALIIVIVIWIITFAIALMMANQSSKRGVILTNQRIICIIGKDKVELKK